jgi:NADH-quinone oxidoreductase subunit M
MNIPLSLVIWLPAVAALILQFLGENGKTVKLAALVLSAATLALNLVLALGMQTDDYRFQALERIPWIDSLGISYQVGIDGISVWLTVLASFMTLVLVGATSDRTSNLRGFFGLILFLESAMLGAFTALDLVLFFTCFELTLIPMYFLVSLWGGTDRKRAATKFVVFTFAGSIFMLIGIVALALQHRAVTGVLSFDILKIQALVSTGELWTNAMQAQTLIFWAFALGFMVKTPAFPFHSWIGDTYAEAPTAGPVLSSVMVKLGTYGFLRFCLPLFPDAVKAQAPVLMAIATIGILYGALVAIGQSDIRRMIGYSSLSHMGFVLLGIFSLSDKGMLGAGFQQFSHGITTGVLVLMVGILFERHGTADMNQFGGLKAKMPVFAAIFLLGMLGSLALPGTNGFIGEFLALLGAFETGAQGLYGLSAGFAAAAGLGVILGAAYLLVMFQKVFYGPVPVTEGPDPVDVPIRSLVPQLALVALVYAGGLAPNFFLSRMERSTTITREMVVNPAGSRPIWSLDAVASEGKISEVARK